MMTVSVTDLTYYPLILIRVSVFVAKYNDEGCHKQMLEIILP